MNYSKAIQHFVLLLLLSLGFSGLVMAKAVVEDCYVKAHVPVDNQIYKSSVVVLLDETTIFDLKQQAHIREQIGSVVQSGTELKMFTFSAFIQDRYTSEVIGFKLASLLEEKVRLNMRKDDVKDFDSCLVVSKRKAVLAVDDALTAYFASSSSSIAKSDIAAAVKSVGDSLLRSSKRAERKLVLVSDMLENSDVTSFYGSGVPRKVLPADELAKMVSKSMLTDLNKSSVYVIGAGVFPVNTSKKQTQSYRTSQTMSSLRDFWTLFFVESNAKLMGFGQPLLLSPIVGN